MNIKPFKRLKVSNSRNAFAWYLPVYQARENVSKKSVLTSD